MDTDNWHEWNGDCDNSNESKADYKADDVSDIEQDNGIEDPESPEQPDVSARQNVPRLIRPTQRAVKIAEQMLMTVNAMETKRDLGNKLK